jgi:hypothetical protein
MSAVGEYLFMLVFLYYISRQVSSLLVYMFGGFGIEWDTSANDLC